MGSPGGGIYRGGGMRGWGGGDGGGGQCYFACRVRADAK